MTAAGPVLQPASFILGAGTSLAAAWLLCRWQKRRFLALERDLLVRQAECAAAVESLRAALRELCQDVDALEEGGPGPAPQAPARNGMNLSLRSQALRLHRRGTPPEQIAAELRVPAAEVRLLLKVHEIVVSNL